MKDSDLHNLLSSHSGTLHNPTLFILPETSYTEAREYMEQELRYII